MAKKETDSYEDDVLREFNESQKGLDPTVTYKAHPTPPRGYAPP